MNPEQSAQRVLDLIDSLMENEPEWQFRFLTVIVQGLTRRFKDAMTQMKPL